MSLLPPETVPYRVVELPDVSDRTIEEALNREAAEGFRFESIHFVSQPGSRRPTMAFLFFTSDETPRRG
ncbi:MAG: DUF4177 domain-containing protein [Deltaproteobacteria bacterium]|nr:MAG: DUF4177 domain-containing protein [Deltaproteobacteria bacterium]